jgi:hypothetical protein
MLACGSPMSNRDLWCSEHSCGADPLAYTTDDEHVELLAHVLDNINAASGLALRIDADGSPVAFEPVVLGREGQPVCGVTKVAMWAGEAVSVDVEIATVHIPGCTPQWAVLRHEILCHALRRVGDNAHTESGVCSVNGMAGPSIDEESLSFALD